jgi:hypothetical protein
MSGIIDWIDFKWGPVADPGPEFMRHFWEDFTQAQRITIMVRELDSRINTLKLMQTALTNKLVDLEKMKSMLTEMTKTQR